MQTIVKVYNQTEFSKLVYGNGGMPKIENLDKNLKFFSYKDCHNSFAPDLYCNSFRMICVVNNNKTEIYALAKFAIFGSTSDRVSLSYISTHKDYLNKGLSRLILDKTFEYFENEFNSPHSIFHNLPIAISEFTPSGYKYIRPYFLSLCEKYNLPFYDNVVGHQEDDCDREEFSLLHRESRILYNKTYKDKKYYVYQDEKKKVKKRRIFQKVLCYMGINN